LATLTDPAAIVNPRHWSVYPEGQNVATNGLDYSETDPCGKTVARGVSEALKHDPKPSVATNKR